MGIDKTYNSQSAENKWYSHWLEKGYFNSEPDEREPYTIVIPPPNVTGVLHMGHMLNNTLQDVLVRKARMEGKNACWVPGTDHASIATEAKVVAMLKEKGIDKNDITREEFLKHAWEWKEKYGGIILKQLERLGASCDWKRTRFTMEDDLSKSVIKVFVDLYNKGHIYRGVRMINWDPAGLTAISDEEVNHKEVNSKLYYVKYKLVNEDGSDLNEFITIATTRPETILGDTAVCVHPDDERYAHLKGKSAIIPMVDRQVPIIFDEYITMEFGTGALKVTPAHDINDYELGIKHNVKSIDVIADDGTMSEAAGHYIGEDRFKVRKKISADLDEMGLLVKIEEIKNKVGYSERTNAVIEPKLSMQWFLKMEELSKPALEHVMNDDVQLIPEKFKNSYRSWMENVRDWCVSRQLWWGQRIPAWYLPNGEFVVAETEAEALELAKNKTGNADLTLSEMNQEGDVVDTWFSSWLWPITVFDGLNNPDNEDIKYYYPTNDLITAPEILFFWVARMIIAGYEYRDEKPFKNVYLTGIVRDKQGRKMSKSLGNSPDPLELIDKYSADGVRVGMLLCSPAGNDLPFDESLCEQGRNFNNKIWNALKLIKGWEIKDSVPSEQLEVNRVAVKWFDEKFNEVLETILDHYSKYRISDALMSVYKLVWDDFCAWFLEMVKPPYQKPIDKETYEACIVAFEKVLKVMHPFTPFISEEIWHLLKDRNEGEDLVIAEFPILKTDYNKALLKDFSLAEDVITQLRSVRREKNISPKELLELFVKEGAEQKSISDYESVIMKLANVTSVSTYSSEVPQGVTSFLVRTLECYIPFEEEIDVKAESEKIQKEIAYQEGFLNSVMKKLGNEKFMANAKQEVIAMEQKKKQDAESKIKQLSEQLGRLSEN
ncbi:MAG: valine--tRNA ligase [Bacteroidia bacterium]|nr:valine--tRNA ligase [Bacteroidia bacterium]